MVDVVVEVHIGGWSCSGIVEIEVEGGDLEKWQEA
jgi:hypothetical protein